MNRRMLAAVLYGPGDVRMEEVDVPRIGPEEVLAKVEAASVDFTDRKVFLRGQHPMIMTPGVFGHEWAGTIVLVGEALSGGWRPGMRVVAANSAPCLPFASPRAVPSDDESPCRACRRDRQNLCERLLYLNGAYAPYIRLPNRIVKANLYGIPSEIPFEEASLSEPLACVVHAVRRILIHPGDVVAMIGCGPIGLLFIALLRSRYGGQIRILAFDHHEDRLQVAGEFGADLALNTSRCPERSEGMADLPSERADVAIEAVGTVEAHEEALGLLGRGGTLVSFGGIAPGTRMAVDIGRMHYEELQILPIYHHTPADFAQAVMLIVRREIPVGRLITDRLPLQELPKALEIVAERRALKVIIDPGLGDEEMMRFRHFKAVYWVMPEGPLGGAYTPVIVHDDCKGCLVCERTTDWFMEFARLARDLIGINLRDCLHWGHLVDNPRPLIVPTSNLQQINRETLDELRKIYCALPKSRRPKLQAVWPHDRKRTPSERFEDRLAIVQRMIELWEDGQYIGWPS